jgi:toxin FitB
MSFLLDTNVIAEVRKPSGDPNVHAWFASVSGDELYLSVLVLGEIRQGIERLRPRDPAQAGVFETWLSTISRDFSDRVIPVSADVAQQWGRLNAPDPMPAIDGLMAATAKVHGLTFVTRNTRHVERAGVSLLNPFEGRWSHPSPGLCRVPCGGHMCEDPGVRRAHLGLRGGSGSSWPGSAWSVSPPRRRRGCGWRR